MLKLRVIGSLAVLILAKQRGLIPALAPLLEALRAEEGPRQAQPKLEFTLVFADAIGAARRECAVATCTAAG